MVQIYKTCFSIASVSLVTLLIRMLPVLCLAHRDIPEKISNILLFIPTSILTTIAATEIIHNKSVCIHGIPIAVPAAILSFTASYISRSLFIAILTSVVAYFVLQNI